MSNQAITRAHIEALNRHDCVDDIGGVYAMTSKERSLCETLHAWGFLELVRQDDRGPLYRTNDAGRAAMGMANYLQTSAAKPTKTHELKTLPVSFEAIWDGRKLFDVRQNDRGFATGDLLALREWVGEENRYTGRELLVEVTYLMQGVFGLPAGLCVMSIKTRTFIMLSTEGDVPSAGQPPPP